MLLFSNLNEEFTKIMEFDFVQNFSFVFENLYIYFKSISYSKFKWFYTVSFIFLLTINEK